MEKRHVSPKPTGTCGKIYKAVAENCPLRSIHRLPLRSKIPISGNGTASPNQSGRRTNDSPSRTHFFLKKLVAPLKTHPGEVNIPIEHGPSNPSVSQQKNDSLIVLGTPTIQSQPSKPATATVISGSEKVKTTVASGNAQLPKVLLSNKESKPMQKTETKIPPSNIIVIESPGRGINAIATPKVESATKPRVPVQGLQPKPKSQPAAPVGVKVMANKDEPSNDTQVKEDKKPGNVGAHDHNLKYSDYIEHVKSQLRTKSNVAEETTTAMPPTRAPTKRDSFNEKVSNFITRAKKNIKMTHLSD